MTHERSQASVSRLVGGLEGLCNLLDTFEASHGL